jgi:myo-inositol-1(or 4)-monophosphatase
MLFLFYERKIILENPDKYKNVMFEAADEAAKILLEYFGKDFEIDRKKFYNDLVTEVDKKSEAKIIEVIRKSFPEHSFLGEEGGEQKKKSEYLWIIDPIDGTVNYAHALPIFCISIALEINGVVSLGVVYNPVSKEKFYAERGKGAYLNGKKISVSDNSEFKGAFLVTGFAYNAENDNRSTEHFVRFVKLGLPVRRLGSAAMDICYVACGIFDAFWEANLNPWDVAAAYLILQEAGGKITDYKGGEYSIYNKQILATNGQKALHEEMIKVLAEE